MIPQYLIIVVLMYSCLVYVNSEYPTANLSTSWINNPDLSTWSIDGTRVTTLLLRETTFTPEWLSSVITEKVDVYSFGVMTLEILCGRKICDESKPNEERYLLAMFKRKAEEGQWLDLVCQYAESDVAKVKQMMQISARCIQSDHEKRPCMSMVIKALEGVEDAWEDSDQNLLGTNHLLGEIPQDITLLPSSLLSGPR